MRPPRLVCLSTILLSAMALAQSNPVPLAHPGTSGAGPNGTLQGAPKAQATILDSYGKLPLRFEANQGQTDQQVKFLSRTNAYTLFLTGQEAVLALNNRNKSLKSPAGTADSRADRVVRMKLRGANQAARVTGMQELAGTSNYFIGNDPAQWRTNVPTYERVKYEKIYSGIDLVYYGNQRQLEFDFIVAAGANPRRIQFEVGGAKEIRTDEQGDLVLQMGEDEIRWHKPVAYQERAGKRQEIASRYSITGGNQVGFEVAKYDSSRPLYIDPLLYSTFLGGTDVDGGASIAVDSAGNAYITGVTSSADFPTVNALQSITDGVKHVFVAKLDATGSALIYSTYLGGNGTDFGAGIATDSTGNAYVTGVTFSNNFPTMNPLQAGNAGANDGFVTKINPTGSALVYSTYLGGTGADGGTSIAVDSSGNAYVAGDTHSSDFPTVNALQTTHASDNWDAFVTEINASGSALVYSTYLGGAKDDFSFGIAVDSSGNAYVTGDTYSTDFPTANATALQATYGGGGNTDAFVTEINSSGSALVYSTYLGGFGNDHGVGIAVDSSGNTYFAGYTASANFPTANPLQSTHGGGSWDAVVAKISPSGSAFVYSTYLGGTGDDYGFGIAADSAGNAYITGQTTSTDFPTMNALQPANGGTQNAFVAMMNPTGSAFVYSTYFGGSGSDAGTAIALDSAGNVYFTGNTSSADFPTTNPLQATYGGGTGDAFVAKIGGYSSSTAIGSSLNPAAFGQSVTFTATVTSQGPGTPTGTVTFMDGATSLGSFALVGNTATLKTNGLTAGTHTITATYGGDTTFSKSTSTALSQVVTRATTTTTLTSSSNPSPYGQTVIFTSKVSSAVGPPPDGETVTFNQGMTVLGAGTLSGGTATLSIATLGVGTDTITAVYGGDSNFGGNTSKVVKQLVTTTTTTTLTSSLNPSNSGQSVTFVANVVPQFGGTVKGTVTFYDGTTVLKTAAVNGGIAKFTTKKLMPGVHSIKATYNGSVIFGASSDSLPQTVN